jgi:hypothetical protein
VSQGADCLKQQGKVIKFHDKDERDELAIFIAENPGPCAVDCYLFTALYYGCCFAQ